MSDVFPSQIKNNFILKTFPKFKIIRNIWYSKFNSLTCELGQINFYFLILVRLQKFSIKSFYKG